MIEIDLKKLTINDARKLLLSGKITACDLAEKYLIEIKKKNSDLNAYLEIYEDVLFLAHEADKKIKAGENAPLLGIPLALKDNILFKGHKASASSKMLENYIAPYDSTVVKKLKSAGAVFVGRTNMDEFAMGSSTEKSAFGRTKNPIDPQRVAGGSSGGSTVAVSAHLALGALGSDTGGSIRQPAGFCGVVGFKPTYGAVSRYGLMAMGSSLDVIGPITKTVTDAEIIFKAIVGRDELDSTSIEIEEKKSSDKKTGKVADMSEFFTLIGNLKSEIIENYQAGLDRLRKLGYEIIKPKTDLSPLNYSLPIYYIIMPAEVSANLARFDGMRYGFHIEGEDLLSAYKETKGKGFGPEVRRRIILGTYVLSAGYYDAYYGKAQALRALIKKTFSEIMKEVDLIALPTSPSPAFKAGEKSGSPVEMYLEDIFTITANIVGAPAISLPFGNVKIEDKDLPLGFQLMADCGKDYFLLGEAKKFMGES